jgi:hypothetical protein
MIAVPSFQFRTGKSLAGKRASECAAGLLSSCAKWRHCCEQKYQKQLFHPPVLEQSRRVVQSLSMPSTSNRSTKANKAVETASDISTFCDTGLKAGVNKIGPGRVAEWQCLDSHAD